MTNINILRLAWFSSTLIFLVLLYTNNKINEIQNDLDSEYFHIVTLLNKKNREMKLDAWVLEQLNQNPNSREVKLYVENLSKIHFDDKTVGGSLNLDCNNLGFEMRDLLSDCD